MGVIAVCLIVIIAIVKQPTVPSEGVTEAAKDVNARTKKVLEICRDQNSAQCTGYIAEVKRICEEYTQDLRVAKYLEACNDALLQGTGQ